MGQRWNLRIGTKTTTRKKSAIQAALSGRLEQRQYDYVQAHYKAALYNWFKLHLPNSLSSQDIQDFANTCVNDAFIRIKEYEQKKLANSEYKFRGFLKGIVFKALQDYWREKKPKNIDIDEYLKENESIIPSFSGGISNELSQEFVRDALLKMKEEEEVSYEVFYRRFREEMSYAEIYKQLKDIYPATITSEKACRQVYNRALPKLQHIFRQVIKDTKYVDKDLPFSRKMLSRMRAETTKK